MSKRLTGLNPLAYLGVEATMPPNMYMSRSAPTSNDSRNFDIGDFWIDITTETLYVLVNLDGGVATWITTFGGATTNFVTNSGTATESGGAINILGDGTNIITSGAGSTVSIAFGTSPIIDNLTLTGNLHVEGTTTLDSALTLTGFTGGVLTSNGSGVVGEVATTNHSLLVGNASGTITNLGVATNGQIPIGSTGNNPVLATITAGSGISVTNGAGTITIANTEAGGTVTSITAGTGITLTPSPITTTGSVALTVPVVVSSGGTGDTSFTAYSVLCGGTTSTNPLQNVSGVGTSGYILTSNGAGTLPTWQPNMGSSGGAFAFIQKQTAASVTSLAFTTGITTAFDNYVLVFDSIEATQTGSAFYLELQLSTDGGSTYITTGYGNSGATGPLTSGFILASYLSSNPAGTGAVGGSMNLVGITSGGAGNLPSSVTGYCVYDGSSSSTSGAALSSMYLTASTVANAFKIILSNGGTFSGTFTLYGLENAGSSGGTLTVDGNSGSATPAAGVLNIVGTGGITTSGSGSTVTINGGTVPQTVTITLTSAQIKSLQATPIQILAAQGANTLIFPISVISFLSYGGTNAFILPSSGITSIFLYFTSTNTGNTIISPTTTPSCYTQTTSNYQLISIPQSNEGTPTASCINQPVYVAIDSTAGSEITGNAAGDNTITIQLQYQVITVPL